MSRYALNLKYHSYESVSISRDSVTGSLLRRVDDFYEIHVNDMTLQDS